MGDVGEVGADPQLQLRASMQAPPAMGPQWGQATPAACGAALPQEAMGAAEGIPWVLAPFGAALPHRGWGEPHTSASCSRVLPGVGRDGGGTP